jgi:hypothetical protein
LSLRFCIRIYTPHSLIYFSLNNMHINWRVHGLRTDWQRKICGIIESASVQIGNSYPWGNAPIKYVPVFCVGPLNPMNAVVTFVFVIRNWWITTLRAWSAIDNMPPRIGGPAMECSVSRFIWDAVRNFFKVLMFFFEG